MHCLWLGCRCHQWSDNCMLQPHEPLGPWALFQNHLRMELHLLLCQSCTWLLYFPWWLEDPYEIISVRELEDVEDEAKILRTRLRWFAIFWDILTCPLRHFQPHSHFVGKFNIRERGDRGKIEQILPHLWLILCKLSSLTKNCLILSCSKYKVLNNTTATQVKVKVKVKAKAKKVKNLNPFYLGPLFW